MVDNFVEKANESVNSIIEKVVIEDDYEKTKDLINLFNAAQSKKSVLRIAKLSDLMDHISDAMTERFEKNHGEFSNKDLIDYMNVVQSTLDKTSKSVMEVENAPIIQLNQTNQVNIGVGDTLSSESRDKIADAIKAILNKNNQVIDADYEVVEEKKDGE